METAAAASLIIGTVTVIYAYRRFQRNKKRDC